MTDKRKQLKENLKGLFAKKPTRKSIVEEINEEISPQTEAEKEEVQKAAKQPEDTVAESKTEKTKAEASKKAVKPKAAAPQPETVKATSKSQTEAKEKQTPSPKPEDKKEEEKPAPAPVQVKPVQTAEVKPVELAVKTVADIENVEDEEEYRQILIFSVGDGNYGVSVENIQTIIKTQQVFYLPGTHECIRGLINLRGEVVPVFDLRKRFGLPEKENDDQTRFVVLELGEYLAGIIVDEILGVETIAESSFSKPSGVVKSIDNRYMEAIARHNDRIILQLDLRETIFAISQDRTRTLA